MTIAGDCTFNYTFDYTVEKRADGNEYMVLHNDSLTFDTQRVYMRLENLFNGDRLLGKVEARRRSVQLALKKHSEVISRFSQNWFSDHHKLL